MINFRENIIPQFLIKEIFKNRLKKEKDKILKN